MRVLFVGDIVGRAGRRAAAVLIPRLRVEKNIDAVVVNAENAAAGAGINPKIAEALWESGADIITTGNHAWDKREGLPLIESGRLLRPANYPSGVTGVGSMVARTKKGEALGVLCLQGRVFMKAIDGPFRTARREIESLHAETVSIVVDFHAEATSEKLAMGWYLDGDVAAVVGTHTHVQTADERVLPHGTAYITDVGMTGPFDSVIGMDTKTAIQRLITGLNPRLVPAKNDVRLSGVIIDIDGATGLSTGIERVNVHYAHAGGTLSDDEESD